ncbi:hypothetical protein KL86DYS2_10820 [uncultured Dysgonomonas sp.]|uniref:Uncharacterized protein n=1 Tax=uncultured Dysgonomonas sp. TaxID=206096 RepID=A0A212J6V6_9BACT|nr:hypothetical protein KL86DYS2_10820 [uncultured Dysgonomonas sp.]
MFLLIILPKVHNPSYFIKLYFQYSPLFFTNHKINDIAYTINTSFMVFMIKWKPYTFAETIQVISFLL